MDNNSTTKGDILSTLSLLMLGIIVFFGVLFKTGDIVQSIILSVLIFAVLMIFVFFAAFAKRQKKYQSKWAVVKSFLIILYVIALVPCYFFSARFFNIQFQKEDITLKVQKDVHALDALFGTYTKKCDARISAYQVNLEAMATSSEGRSEIARYLKLEDASDVSQANVNMAVSSFSKSLKGAQYKQLVDAKNQDVKNALSAYNNWNLLSLHQTAFEISKAYSKYADALEKLYAKHDNPIEKEKIEFVAPDYESVVEQAFISPVDFSAIGIVATLIIGLLGLSKFITGKKSEFSEITLGDASEIEEDGGMIL